MAPAIRPSPEDPAKLARLFIRFFDEQGVTPESIMQAVSLSYQRTEVYQRELLDYLSKAGQFRAECAMGCAFCCHTLVTVLEPEAFFIANHIDTAFSSEESAEIRAKVLAYDSANRGKTGAERYEGHIPCALLDEKTQACRIHGARGFTCRAMHSSKLNACRGSFEARDAHKGAPSHKAFFDHTRTYYSGFATALRGKGLMIQPLDMMAALAILWSEKDALGRWLAGEDVFKAANAEFAKP